jgi:hypothetical protein
VAGACFSILDCHFSNHLQSFTGFEFYATLYTIDYHRQSASSYSSPNAISHIDSIPMPLSHVPFSHYTSMCSKKQLFSIRERSITSIFSDPRFDQEIPHRQTNTRQPLNRPFAQFFFHAAWYINLNPHTYSTFLHPTTLLPT